MKLFASWTKGLPQSEVALSILQAGGFAGVEMSNIGVEAVDGVMNSGLELSLHTPGVPEGLPVINLANPNLIGGIRGHERFHEWLEAVKRASVVSYHFGYSARKVFKMVSYPNIPKGGRGGVISDRRELWNVMADNIRKLMKLMERDRGPVLLENMDFSRELPVLWDKQKPEVLAYREEIESAIKEFGTNAGLQYVAEPEFINLVVEKCPGTGILLDVAHAMVAADAMGVHSEDYIAAIMSAGNVKHLHVSVPSGCSGKGFVDAALPFKERDRNSCKARSLARMVLFGGTVDFVTLEISTGLAPVEHAHFMLEQANLLGS